MAPGEGENGEPQARWLLYRHLSSRDSRMPDLGPLGSHLLLHTGCRSHGVRMQAIEKLLPRPIGDDALLQQLVQISTCAPRNPQPLKFVELGEVSVLADCLERLGTPRLRVTGTQVPSFVNIFTSGCLPIQTSPV